MNMQPQEPHQLPILSEPLPWRPETDTIRKYICSTYNIISSYLVRCGGHLGLSLGNNISCSGSIKIFNFVNLLSKDLNRGILVDGDWSRRHEELVGGTVILVDCDDSRFQNCECWNMIGEDTESSREWGNIDLMTNDNTFKSFFPIYTSPAWQRQRCRRQHLVLRKWMTSLKIWLLM